MEFYKAALPIALDLQENPTKFHLKKQTQKKKPSNHGRCCLGNLK